MSVESKLQSFFSRYPVRSYKKRETLIQAGDKPVAYYILSGLVMQYDIAENGTKLTLNIYKPGSYIPLAGILNNIPSQFFFEAVEPATVRVAPAADVATFLKDNPDVTYHALARVTRGGEGLMLRLARAMEGSAENRILQELTIMQHRFFDGKNVITITETDLATRTGLARETISRTLKKLHTDGVILAERGKITLL